jgi:hypothetical protein
VPTVNRKSQLSIISTIDEYLDSASVGFASDVVESRVCDALEHVDGLLDDGARLVALVDGGAQLLRVLRVDGVVFRFQLVVAHVGRLDLGSVAFVERSEAVGRVRGARACARALSLLAVQRSVVGRRWPTCHCRA